MATTAAQNTNSALPSRIRGARLIPHRPAPPNTEELSAKRKAATSNACARFRPDARQSAPPPVERSSNRLRAGFTLLELSIVLVIIGLLIGGVFVGQSLIHNAQLNAVIAEFNKYQTSVSSFKQQYQALPGDMTNATSFWGVAGGTGSDAACQNTISSTALTCNGNGDGKIATSVVSDDEETRFWQHLANAKMIEGSFTGVLGGSWVTGVNVPASKYGNNTAWSVEPSSAFTGGGVSWLAADYNTGNVLEVGVTTATVTPKDAWSIDKKIDDGKPGTGNVIAYVWPTCTTAANQTDLTGAYKLTNTSSGGCGLVFLTNF